MHSAIASQYYSLFNIISSPIEAIATAARLAKRGDVVALKQLPIRRYALWVKETDACPTPAFLLRDLPQCPNPALCYFLTSSEEYQIVEIRVPDLEQSLSAIAIQNRYYSVFKQNVSAEQALSITAKLVRRGDETVILVPNTPTPQYSVCVLEPDAFPIL
ncbi:MAG: hypothetical protein F6K09_12800 [Merismopedia sp. SIO2A8]|nr:hypothetical protein [Merismopedia sp. SIO2A8]